MHLKLGSLALARVELETLAGLGALDTQGLADLAEVRWRTGDLPGAGEAAAAALRTDETDPVALLIAAEAASALGRPSEARRLAARAIAASRGGIDDIFAGMPRSSVWAPDANEPLPTSPTLFDRGPETTIPADPPAPVADEPPPRESPAKSAVGPMTLGFWDADEVEEDPAGNQPDPAAEFEAGRVALVAGSFDEAALRFGLALRLAPALAPAVLEATEGARASVLSVVRGDAYRLAGHESEARQAYAIAARGGLPERRAKVRVRPRPIPVASDDDDHDDDDDDADDVMDPDDPGSGDGSSPDGQAAPDATHDAGAIDAPGDAAHPAD
jgi:hypothetical protein